MVEASFALLFFVVATSIGFAIEAAESLAQAREREAARDRLFAAMSPADRQRLYNAQQSAHAEHYRLNYDAYKH